MEPKGSLFLRSNHMEYGTRTLVSNWHQTREAEPKDHDIKRCDSHSKKLHRSTYKRIGNVTNGELPNTTTHEHMEQIKLKPEFEEQIRRHPMVTSSSFSKTNLDRDWVKSKGNKVLPRHAPEHGKRYLDTTYETDYKSPYTYTPREQDKDAEPDNRAAYKKCHSQFTDTADYKRYGMNTWQDESGIYANTETKRNVFKATNPIPEELL